MKPFETTADVVNSAPPCEHAFPSTYTLDLHKDVIAELLAAKMTACRWHALFELAVASRDELQVELGKKKLAELKQFSTTAFRARNKTEAVEYALDSVLSLFVLDRTVSWTYGEDPMAGKRRAVLSVTDLCISEFLERRAARHAETKRRLTDPQTEDDFAFFIRVRGRDKLSEEQLARFDELIAARTGAAREQERRKLVMVEQFTTTDIPLTLITGFHDKRQCEVWIVQLGERVERAVFNELNRKAKTLLGWYSGFKRESAGFHFLSEESARKFIGLLERPADRTDELDARDERRQQARIDNLAGVSERKADQARDELARDRKTNTHRRLRMAESAEGAARAKLQMADTCRHIAEAMTAGEVKHLTYVRTWADVETLDRVLDRARVERYRKDGWPRDWQQMAPVASDVLHTVYPWPRVSKELLMRVVSNLGDRAGFKLLCHRLASYANQSSHLYDVVFATSRQINDLQSLISKATGYTARVSMWDRETLRASLVEYKRLVRLGLTNLPTLRAALREYLRFEAELAKADPVERAVRAALLANLPGFYPTPDELVDAMMYAAEIEDGMLVGDLSAGCATICDRVRDNFDVRIDVCEINWQLYEILKLKGYNVVERDAMDYKPGPIYDRLLLNPAFENNHDIFEVQHAHSLLKEGGRLVAVVSESAFNQTAAAARFCDWLEEQHAWVGKNKPDAFRSSLRPVGVGTRLVVLIKGGNAHAHMREIGLAYVHDPDEAALKDRAACLSDDQLRRRADAARGRGQHDQAAAYAAELESRAAGG